eukprot:TRINITY_DN1215_c0_g2_i2.p1 TRINITY_DN1215_c0_g2~~TRINITY_DN1215_c0_g2_i2.p1  ORF type:complete len:132 (+),score=16.12 TRINITY_DN1215_c0_g2_i2:131-526(+)
MSSQTKKMLHPIFLATVIAYLALFILSSSNLVNSPIRRSRSFPLTRLSRSHKLVIDNRWSDGIQKIDEKEAISEIFKSFDLSSFSGRFNFCIDPLNHVCLCKFIFAFHLLQQLHKMELHSLADERYKLNST